MNEPVGGEPELGAALGRRVARLRSSRACAPHDGPFVRGGAVQPGRGEAGSQDPRAQGYITALCTERAPSRKAALPRFRGSATGTCARVPADQSARLPITSGRSDPSDAQGSGANSRGTRRAACHDSLPLGARACRPRDGRDVRGPTCARGSPGQRRRGSWPASKAPRWRASFRLGRSSCAMAAPSVKPGARRRGRRGARRSVGWVHARRVPDPRPRARAGRGVRAGATRASGRAVGHAACPRGQAR